MSVQVRTSTRRRVAALVLHAERVRCGGGAVVTASGGAFFAAGGAVREVPTVARNGYTEAEPTALLGGTRRWSGVRAYPIAFTRGTPSPRNGRVRLRTRLVVALPNSASSSTISSRWAIDVAATFMT